MTIYVVVLSVKITSFLFRFTMLNNWAIGVWNIYLRITTTSVESSPRYWEDCILRTKQLWTSSGGLPSGKILKYDNGPIFLPFLDDISCLSSNQSLLHIYDMFFSCSNIKYNLYIIDRYLKDHDNYQRMLVDQERRHRQQKRPKNLKRVRSNSGCLCFSSKSRKDMIFDNWNMYMTMCYCCSSCSL